MALPYVTVQGVGSSPFLQPFGLLILLGLCGGGAAMALSARRVNAKAGDALAIAGISVAVAFVFAHIFDVAWYRLGHDEPVPLATWLKLFDGISLVGGIAGVAVVVIIWTKARRLDTAVYADLAAIGCVVANTIGRIGCALVHDHPGVRTELPIGVDFPAMQAQWAGIRDIPADETVRLHDLGLEELVLMIPLTAIVFLLHRRGARPGLVAAVAAIGYACLRFPLDFLRVNEPVRLLTAGQWGCVVMVLAAVLFGFVLRKPR
ncbi:MAG: prolipoprotein diacylglyceryl transferase family protein [Kofleriaceae bacterium]